MEQKLIHKNEVELKLQEECKKYLHPSAKAKQVGDQVMVLIELHDGEVSMGEIKEIEKKLGIELVSISYYLPLQKEPILNALEIRRGISLSFSLKYFKVKIIGKSEKHGYWLMSNMPFLYNEDESGESGFADVVNQDTYSNDNSIDRIGFHFISSNPSKWIEFAKKNHAEVFIDGVKQ